jgi:N-acylneuraminate cytidylyltransferase/CMP-N,N'-diacetyllegionaminic acid synthase
VNIVGIILARGGSKRLPGKNVRLLLGKPLIAYTIEAARGARSLARTIVSTDDLEIARTAGAFGGEVPFLRPPELASDHSPPVAALAHAVEWLEHGGAAIDAVVLLQATSPMRRSEHIDAAVALFKASGADTVTAVTHAPAHPYWCWRRNGELIEPFVSDAHMATPRHELPEALVETGAVYVLRRDLLAKGTIYGPNVAGYLMDAAASSDIDTIEDFQYAEYLLSRHGQFPEPA